VRRLTIVGLVLIVLGVLGFVYPRITYTKNQTSVDVGPVQLQAKQRKTVTIPDIASGIAIGVGAILAVVGASRGR